MNTRKQGDKFENRVQKQINSGSFWHQKGDLSTDSYLIECKTTEKSSYSINKKLLEKTWQDALESNKLPLLVIGIQDNNTLWKLTVEINKETI